MSRRTAGLDRILLLVVGLALLALGAVTFAWWGGWLFPHDPQVRIPWLLADTRRDWWPWALLGGGVLLVLLVLPWLFGHQPGRGSRTVELAGSDGSGTLDVSTSALVKASAEALQLVPGVRSAQARMRPAGKALQVAFNLVVEPDADLPRIAGAVDRSADLLRSALGTPAVHCRAVLHPRATASDHRRG